MPEELGGCGGGQQAEREIFLRQHLLVVGLSNAAGFDPLDRMRVRGAGICGVIVERQRGSADAEVVVLWRDFAAGRFEDPDRPAYSAGPHAPIREGGDAGADP